MNTNDFKCLDYITLVWELLEDYHIIKSGCYQLPPVAPYTSIVLDIDTNPETVTPSAKYFDNLRFYGPSGEEIAYKIFHGGAILISIHGVPYGQFTETLPRIGVCFEVNKRFNNVVWYGRGEDENYIDRKAHCNFGLYRKDVSKMNYLYDVPQECGTRTDNFFMSLTDECCGLSFIGSDRFTFSCHDFTLDNLIRARHRNELKIADKNYLTLITQCAGWVVIPAGRIRKNAINSDHMNSDFLLCFQETPTKKHFWRLQGRTLAKRLRVFQKHMSNRKSNGTLM